jgi:uncharacterized membrane protein
MGEKIIVIVLIAAIILSIVSIVLTINFDKINSTWLNSDSKNVESSSASVGLIVQAPVEVSTSLGENA